MSEIMECLDSLYDISCNIQDTTENYKIVKTALQRLESIDNADISKALEIIRKCESSNYLNTWYPKFVEDLKTIENCILKSQEQDRVLNLIKKKRVNVDELLDCIRLCHTGSEALEEYNNKVSLLWNDPNDYLLTQEEFDILKRYFG